MIAALLYNNLAMTSPYWCPPSRLCLSLYWIGDLQWGCEANFVCSVICPFFRQKTFYVLNTMFIFDRCHQWWQSSNMNVIQRIKQVLFNKIFFFFAHQEINGQSFSNHLPCTCLLTETTQLLLSGGVQRGLVLEKKSFSIASSIGVLWGSLLP